MTGGSDLIKVFNVTVISMSVVFLTLLSISFILQLFKVVFKEDKNEKKVSKTVNKSKNIKNKKSKVKSDVDLSDNKALVAAFTAAIASSEKKRSSNIKIKSIKKVS
ncbi:MAG: hypothetical protein FH753_06280 [Firmicutes bacterium]|nr:hypothetical protein [Bacillota bacterium]